MYCDGFQKAYAVDPDSMDESFFEHEKHCVECRAFVREVQSLNRHLPSAIGVDVPKSLADNLLKISDLDQKIAYFPGVVKFAMAATIVMAIGLAFLQNPWFIDQSEALPEIVYNHIIHEPEALAAKIPIRDAALRSTMKDFGVPLHSSLDDVVYLKLCPIGSLRGIHMTVIGQRGPVSVMLLPGMKVDQKMPIEFDNLVGYIVPRRSGSVAIVGNQNEALKKMESKIDSAIDWL